MSNSIDSHPPRRPNSDSNIESTLDGPTPVAVTLTCPSKPSNEIISSFSSSSTLTDLDTEPNHREEDLQTVKTISIQASEPSSSSSNDDPEKSTVDSTPGNPPASLSCLQQEEKETHGLYRLIGSALFPFVF